MDKGLKTGLYVAGGVAAGVSAGIGIVKIIKFLYRKSKSAKRNELRQKQKKLENELEELCRTQNILDGHIAKIEEITNNCYNPSTGNFRNNVPGYEGLDFEWITERANQFPIMSQNNKMAIAVKDIQLQEVELALMSLDNIKPNKEGKS